MNLEKFLGNNAKKFMSAVFLAKLTCKSYNIEKAYILKPILHRQDLGYDYLIDVYISEWDYNSIDKEIYTKNFNGVNFKILPKFLFSGLKKLDDFYGENLNYEEYDRKKIKKIKDKRTEERIKKEIEKFIKKYLSKYEYSISGSFARGDWHFSSDLDIEVLQGQGIDIEKLKFIAHNKGFKLDIIELSKKYFNF